MRSDDLPASGSERSMLELLAMLGPSGFSRDTASYGYAYLRLAPGQAAGAGPLRRAILRGRWLLKDGRSTIGEAVERPLRRLEALGLVRSDQNGVSRMSETARQAVLDALDGDTFRQAARHAASALANHWTDSEMIALDERGADIDGATERLFLANSAHLRETTGTARVPRSGVPGDPKRRGRGSVPARRVSWATTPQRSARRSVTWLL